MKYLVTGAAGFIGFHTARRLLDDGHEVVGLDNFNDYYDIKLKRLRASLLKGARIVEQDLADAKKMDELFAKERFDKVIHLGAQAGVRYSLTHPFVYVESNVKGTLSVFEACRKHGVKDVVFASSSSVYGGNTKVPFSEEDRVDLPISLYAATKRDNELMAHAYSKLYGLNMTGLRFFTVYGPFGRPDMAAWLFAKNILAGKPIEVFNHGKMKRDFTYVADIVDGVIKASNNPCRYEIINLGNNKPIDLNYFISLIEKELGKKADKKLMPLQAGDVPATWAEIDKAKRLLKWEPKTKVETGLKLFIEWFKKYEGRT